MTLAYFDCFSGISGDMTLGALVDLGVPVEWLDAQLRALPLDDFDLRSRPVSRHGISAMQVEVISRESHHHRDYRHIQGLIASSPLSDKVKAHSLAVFERIAAAETRIHGCDKETVHFHEVGGVDAIVDIVGACLGMERLGIDAVAASALPSGGGLVKCAHGVLPVPAPATLEILKGVTLYGNGIEKELVTPTGAAILAASTDSFGPMPAMAVRQTGYGAGTLELERQPNLLRVILGEPESEWQTDGSQRLVLVETNIDDMNPEIFGYVMERLFADGALDVFWVPVYMKKNRPGTMVQVLCEPIKKARIVRRLLSETSSLGVRFHEVYRTALEREAITIDSPFGRIAAKRIRGAAGEDRIVPEYEVCKKIAIEKGLPLQRVYDAILKAASI
jgi:uncharacterized protein (TIGR00299 family) protein